MASVCHSITAASASTPAPMIASPIATRRDATSPLGSKPPPVLSCGPYFLEDAFDARSLAVEEGLVVVAEQRNLAPIARLAGLRPLWARVHLLHQGDHRLALRVVHAGRREHAAPVGELDVDALLLQGRRRDVLEPLAGGDCDHPQLARLHLLGELGIAGDAGRHLVAEQR